MDQGDRRSARPTNQSMRSTPLPDEMHFDGISPDSQGPRRALLVLAVALLSVCGGEPTVPFDPIEAAFGDLTQCDLNLDFVVVGASPGAIPSLDEPVFVDINAGAPSYLDPDSRVIGLEVNGEYFAIPHNVLWTHAIANFSAGGVDIAVTYCPLTGSSLAFSRTATGGEPMMISGLLFQNNLVMFDQSKSLWP